MILTTDLWTALSTELYITFTCHHTHNRKIQSADQFNVTSCMGWRKGASFPILIQMFPGTIDQYLALKCPSLLENSTMAGRYKQIIVLERLMLYNYLVFYVLFGFSQAQGFCEQQNRIQDSWKIAHNFWKFSGCHACTSKILHTPLCQCQTFSHS